MVAVDEVDAVLCGTAYEEGLSTEGEALFATLQSVRGLQYLLAAAVLTAAHEKTLNAVFPAGRESSVWRVWRFRRSVGPYVAASRKIKEPPPAEKLLEDTDGLRRPRKTVT